MSRDQMLELCRKTLYARVRPSAATETVCISCPAESRTGSSGAIPVVPTRPANRSRVPPRFETKMTRVVSSHSGLVLSDVGGASSTGAHDASARTQESCWLRASEG